MRSTRKISAVTKAGNQHQRSSSALFPGNNPLIGRRAWGSGATSWAEDLLTQAMRECTYPTIARIEVGRFIQKPEHGLTYVPHIVKTDEVSKRV